MALLIGLTIGGFVLGAAIRYEWDSSGGMEDFWRAGIIGAVIGLVVGTVASAYVVSRGRAQHRRSRLTP